MEPSNTIGREQLRRRPQVPNQGTTQIASDREFAERLPTLLFNLRVNTGNSQHGGTEDERQARIERGRATGREQLRRERQADEFWAQYHRERQERPEGRKIHEQSRQAGDWEVRLEEGRWRLEQDHRNRLQETHRDPSANAATLSDSSSDEDWEAQLEESRRRLAEMRRHEETAVVNARATGTERQPPSLANTQRRYRRRKRVGNNSQPYCPGADTTTPADREAIERNRLLSFSREEMARERQGADAILAAQIADAQAHIQRAEARIAARRDREKRERMFDGNSDIYTYDEADAGTPQTRLTNYKEEFQSPSFFTQTMPRDGRVTASDIPSYNAHRFLDLGLDNTSSFDIEARHRSIAEATGQPRFQEVQTGRYPHSYYQLQTPDVRPISAPPQNNALDDGSRRAIRKMATSGPTGLTRLNSEPGPIMQTRISSRTNDEAMMFDHKDCTNQSKKEYTDEWFRNFECHVRPMFQAKRQQPPVKIAVLDTGIDLKNPAIAQDRGRIKDTRSFVPNGDCTDQDGHGTQVTSLLLGLTCNAHIYVAQIALGKKPDDPAYVAEALRYATETWTVDIINISFGFDSDQEVIGAAIKNAYAANLLIFAAARNDGGNFRAAFPARHKDVISISSTDGKGNSSLFNPPVYEDCDNFATIGEALRFCSSKKGGIYMSSGTSYATPVAVSIASLILEYVRERFPEEERDEAERRLKGSPDGMRAALHLMSNKRDGRRYIAPWKLFDDKGENNVYIHLSSALKKQDHWSN